MNRSTFQWLSLTAAAALLASGCAGRAPQRSPGPTTPAPGPTSVGSTTGDADACAHALGNTVNTASGDVTANGIIIGNVALVGLPTTSEGMAPTPSAGAPGFRPQGTTAPGGAANVRTTPVAPGGNVDRTGTPEMSPTGSTPPTGTAGRTTTPGTAGVGTDNMDAVSRIRSACPKLVEVKVVNDPADRTRLGEIARSMREGQPVTAFMDDISRMSKTASTAATGATPGGATAPGAPATPTTPTPTTPTPPTGSRLTPGPIPVPVPRVAPPPRPVGR